MEAARQVGDLYVAAANRSGDAGLAKAAALRGQEIREIEAAGRGHQKGPATVLATQPADASRQPGRGQVSLLPGRRLKRGLPMLAQGSDAGLEGRPRRGVVQARRC